ncbi:hypothetical protein KKB71_02190 [Patescibacteria group bacterium]|nr:hypothetical protein [Patescibacteria group bacterium]
MTSAILHLILALLSFAGGLVIHTVWAKHRIKEQYIKRLSSFFFLFTFCHLSFGLPYLIYQDNLRVLAWGYNFAIAFMFLSVIFIWKMVFEILCFSAQKIRSMTIFFLFLALITVLVQIFNMRLPTIFHNGFIIWNGNLISGTIISLHIIFLVILWIYILLKNWPKEITFIEKLKSVLITIGAILMGSSFIYYIAYNYTMVLLSFIFVFLGTTIFIIPFLIPKKREIQ